MGAVIQFLSPFTFRDHIHIFVGQSSPSFSSTVTVHDGFEICLCDFTAGGQQTPTLLLFLLGLGPSMAELDVIQFREM